MYADDTSITISESTIKAVETKLNSQLDEVHTWIVANKLSLNVSKTEYMVIGQDKRYLKLQVILKKISVEKK